MSGTEEYYLQIPGGGVDRKKEKRRDKVFEGRAGTGEPAEREGGGGGGRVKLVKAPSSQGLAGKIWEGRPGRERIAGTLHLFLILPTRIVWDPTKNVAELGVIMWHFFGFSHVRGGLYRLEPAREL